MAAATGASLPDVSFLTAAQAAAVDEELMSPAHGWSLDQLMELAGLSCACAIAEAYPAPAFSRVLVLAGEGACGGRSRRLELRRVTRSTRPDTARRTGQQRRRRLGVCTAPAPLRLRAHRVLPEAHG